MKILEALNRAGWHLIYTMGIIWMVVWTIPTILFKCLSDICIRIGALLPQALIKIMKREPDDNRKNNKPYNETQN